MEASHTSLQLLYSAKRAVCVPVLCQVIQVNVCIDGIGLSEVQQFLQSLVDEDDADESGKCFLCEACDVTHQRARVSCHQHYTEECCPQSDTGTQGQVGHPIIPSDT